MKRFPNDFMFQLTIEEKVLSYVFLCTKDIDIIPNVRILFSFSKNTVVRFDYCFQQQNQSAFLKLYGNPLCCRKT
ncbi:MAG: hypothetical protein H6Q13_2749 [Bacteroidetes bacterium]|nr:hypothetical protein [Bacteroidota bacterium]